MKCWIFAMSMLLAGCVTESPADDAAARAALAANVPVCSDQRQCEGMWSAARNWVNATCGMKIQTMTDTYIETYNSTNTDAACRVTKDPRPEGGYTFHVAVSCGNMFGCVPSAVSVVGSFQSTVKAAGAAFAPKT